MTASDVAGDLIRFYAGDPGRWTQGVLTRDIEGNQTFGSRGADAYSWCIDGAIRAIYKEHYAVAQDALRTMFPKYLTFNDWPGRTFDEVVEKLTSVRDMIGT